MLKGFDFYVPDSPFKRMGTTQYVMFFVYASISQRPEATGDGAPNLDEILLEFREKTLTCETTNSAT